MEYSSAIKNEIMPFAVTDEPRDYHTKWSKSDRGKTNMWYYMCHLKNDTNELIHKSRLTDLENKLMVTRGRKEKEG